MAPAPTSGTGDCGVLMAEWFWSNTLKPVSATEPVSKVARLMAPPKVPAGTRGEAGTFSLMPTPPHIGSVSVAASTPPARALRAEGSANAVPWIRPCHVVPNRPAALLVTIGLRVIDMD